MEKLEYLINAGNNIRSHNNKKMPHDVESVRKSSITMINAGMQTLQAASIISP
jgi:hypothetical protein